MKKPLISVIIPIYKAEKYLEKCIRCVLKQTYQNLEVILVDDGSPDGSGVICDRLATEDSRIKVIHKENGGAATARNAGLDVMTGEYIAFVDADDYMEQTYIEKLYEIILKNQADVAICGFYTIDEAGNAVSIDALHDEAFTKEVENKIREYTGNDIILQDLQGHWEHVAPWGKLYKSDLFTGIQYPKWPAYEDEYVFIKVFDRVQKAVTRTDKLYYYVQHAGSLMNGDYSEIKRNTYLTMWRERIAFYNDNNPKHKALYNPVLQAYVAWNVLYLSLHGEQMTKGQQNELKDEIKKYFWSLLKKPYLFNRSYNAKLALKCILTLIDTNILRKRYVR